MGADEDFIRSHFFVHLYNINRTPAIQATNADSEHRASDFVLPNVKEEEANLGCARFVLYLCNLQNRHPVCKA